MPLRFFPIVLTAPLLAGGLSGPVLLLDKNGKPRETLKDVIAILEPLAAPKPTLEKRPLLRIRTVGKRFSPRVAWTTPGSQVTFPNQDSIVHNVFSVCCTVPFDTGQYEPGDTPAPIKLVKPGLLKLYCNVHHRMNAFLWVLETPYAQVLDGKTGLAFDGIPSGTYRLKLWHPETGERTFPVTIDQANVHGEWTLSANLPPFEPHKNKFGKDYPPMKDEGSY